MASIRIKRPKRYFFWAHDFEVYIDGERAGILENGQTKDFQTTDGSHQVYLKMHRYSSPTTTIEASANNTRIWKANFHQLAYAFLHASVPGFIAIVLERQNDNRYSVLIVCLVTLSIVLAALSIYFFTTGRSKFLRITEIPER
ncbi:MAG: hypothetical protein ACKOZM_04105 [Flavobacteriales bacterium]